MNGKARFGCSYTFGRPVSPGDILSRMELRSPRYRFRPAGDSGIMNISINVMHGWQMLRSVEGVTCVLRLGSARGQH